MYAVDMIHRIGRYRTSLTLPLPRRTSMASRRKSGSEDDDEKKVRVIKGGECSKFFHVDCKFSLVSARDKIEET